MNKKIAFTKEFLKEEGFTLLELVVAVGIILILSVTGLVGYSKITDSARKAATEKAVDEVFTAAIAYDRDTDSKTTPQSAVEEWNSTRKNDSVEVFLVKDKNPITIAAKNKNLPLSKPNEHGDEIYSAYRSEDEVKNGGDIGNTNPGTVDPTTPTIRDNTIEMTINCDFGTSEYDDKLKYRIPLANLSDGTQVFVKNNQDGSIVEVPLDNNVPKLDIDSNYNTAYGDSDGVDYTHSLKNTLKTVSIKNGVDYKIIVKGSAEIMGNLRVDNENNYTFNNRLCLRSIDHWGENSGLKEITGLNANFLENVPNNLPSSVTSLRGVFYGCPRFNDPNVSNWDVSHVTDLGNAFYFAEDFNQPLDKWDVSNVTDMRAMFRASAFNQPLNSWDVSNVKRMDMMMSATFNQPLDNWDVSNVTDMTAMFMNSAFNQNINNWNVSNVKNMSHMFKDSSFNQPLDKWDVSNVTSMGGMFYGAKYFDQDLSTWKIKEDYQYLSDFYPTKEAYASEAFGILIHQKEKLPVFFQ